MKTVVVSARLSLRLLSHLDALCEASLDNLPQSWRHLSADERVILGESRSPHGVRRYRCSSRTTFTEPSKRCKGYVSANDAEGRVWNTIEQVLPQPEMIAGEGSRQQARAEEQCTEILREISRIEDTMSKCDREEQRWAQAYMAEVVNLAELKGHRSEIATRRQNLLAQRHDLQTNLNNIGHALEHVEALMGYCEPVRRQLQSFDPAGKRQAFEALNVRITWTPGQPLAIEGTIPVGEIVPVLLHIYMYINKMTRLVNRRVVLDLLEPRPPVMESLV